MRVAAYVREIHGSSVFAQSEQVRRWAAQEGHHLLATFQDVRTPTGDTTRSGLRALLGLTERRGVDAVVVASVSAFSADLVIQEVVMTDLRHRGVQVISVLDTDMGTLTDPPSDAARLFVRDVLARNREYERLEEGSGEPAEDDVLIELIKSA